MKFEYYVLNYNHNHKQVELFNIFDNWLVQEEVEKIIKKYLRSPSKYMSKSFVDLYTTKYLYGFPALCEDIRRTIACQEHGRFEYEISCGYKFETDCDNLQVFDCYDQIVKNIEIITRECIYQYKKQLKEHKNV